MKKRAIVVVGGVANSSAAFGMPDMTRKNFVAAAWLNHLKIAL